MFPILGDALEEAGCDNPDLLRSCRKVTRKWMVCGWCMIYDPSKGAHDPLEDVRWSTLMRAVLSYALWRRDSSERENLEAIALQQQASGKRRKRTEEMKNTIAQQIMNAGREEGREETVVAAFQPLLEEGTAQFGEPGQETLSQLQGISDIRQLMQMYRQLDQAKSWRELLQLIQPNDNGNGTD